MIGMMVERLANLQKWLEPYPGAYDLTIIIALLLAAWLANWITKRVLLRGLRRALRATALGGKHHDQQVQLRVIPRLANVVPALVISAGVQVVPHLPAALVTVIQAICQAFIVLTIALAISRALDLFNQAYEKRPDAHNKPIKGYLQVAKIVMFALVGISIIATLIGAKFLHIVTHPEDCIDPVKDLCVLFLRKAYAGKSEDLPQPFFVHFHFLYHP